MESVEQKTRRKAPTSPSGEGDVAFRRKREKVTWYSRQTLSAVTTTANSIAELGFPSSTQQREA